MRALICCIREMVRATLVQLEPVYINFNTLHNPPPDKTRIVSFVRLIDIGSHLGKRVYSVRRNTVSHDPVL